MSTHDDLIRGLRAGAAHTDPHVRAAVELLINHGHWLRNGHFVRACVHTDPDVDPGDDVAWINWRHARDAHNQGLIGSSTELAVLDYAIALAENRYRLTAMDRANARLIADATLHALGLTHR